MRRTSVLALAPLAALLLAGCPSYSLMQGPRTLEPGQVALTGSVGTVISPAGMGGLPYASYQEEGALRVGVAPNVDLGLRLSLNDLGVRGDVKVRVLHTDSLQLSIIPGAGTSLWPLLGDGALRLVSDESLADLGIAAHLYGFYLPVVLGVSIGGQSLFYFGPQLTVTNWKVQAIVDGSANSVGGLTWMPGFVAGVDLDMGASHTYPEIDVSYDPMGGGLFLQFGIATSFEMGGAG